jgi:hypothetical protein
MTPPIVTSHLFPLLDSKLLELLRSLSHDEWYKPTLAKKWLVKDIAAHLLDSTLRTLSFGRDKHQLTPNNPVNTYQDLVDYLNELNAVWVNAYRRVSPRVLTDQLESKGKEFCAYITTLDPGEEALFPVAWAGESVSQNWFNIAREYTEKFHHQQQIREAVGKPGIMTKELYFPFIDTLMFALPYTYRNVESAAGTVIHFVIETDLGGNWYLTRKENDWTLSKQSEGPFAATVSLEPNTAWKLFTKGMNADEAKQSSRITGDHDLAEKVFGMISVMA